MPAAAVIPAPIAYIKVVAVKKLVVGSRVPAGGSPRGAHCPSGPSRRPSRPVLFTECRRRAGTFTLKKLECSRQARGPE